MSASARRVVARFLEAKVVPVGETIESGMLRIHRYRDVLHVTDLTFAGKRGKKVELLAVDIPYSFKEGDRGEMLDNVSEGAVKSRTMPLFKAFLDELGPSRVNYEVRSQRAIDVVPAGTRTIKLRWTAPNGEAMELEADPMQFQVTRHQNFTGPRGNSFVQSTSYWPAKKPDAKRFYNWLVANGGEAKVPKMGIEDFRKVWDANKVRYDYH